MKRKLLPYIALLTMVTFLGACTDEVENLIERKADPVFDTLTVLPNKRILEYSVENTPEVIYSSIDDNERTITVYLPHYYLLRVIDPLISLPEGTTISPDDDELVPVFSEEPFVYTVSTPDREDAHYTVLPIIQQPEIIMDELSTAEDTTVYLFPSSNGITITGANFIPNLNITSTYLIDEDENEWPFGVAAGQELIWRSNFINYPAPTSDFTEGIYWVEMRAYALTTRMKYPIYLKRN